MNLLLRDTGTYILIFSLGEKVQIPKVGRYQNVVLLPGYYIYVGSAFNPGGILARVGRHYQVVKPTRWQIDYMRPYLTMLEAWVTYDPIKRECDWSMMVHRELGGKVLYERMGGSDCTTCPAHLYGFEQRPDFDVFRRAVVKHYPSHAEIELVNQDDLILSPWSRRDSDPYSLRNPPGNI